MSRWLQNLGCVILVAFLASCAVSVAPIPPDVATAGMPNAELALQNSMGEVRAAMAELNGMQVAVPPSGFPVVAAELERPISFIWSGLLDQGVETLANRIGYCTTITGPTPSKSLKVSVDLSNVTALDAFRALGNAAGSSATVIVDPDHHRVEVDHHV
jgi:defect-in-organelle-trafficking protein DotD